jgi:hypothetical protein
MGYALQRRVTPPGNTSSNSPDISASCSPDSISTKEAGFVIDRGIFRFHCAKRLGEILSRLQKAASLSPLE